MMEGYKTDLFSIDERKERKGEKGDKKKKKKKGFN